MTRGRLAVAILLASLLSTGCHAPTEAEALEQARREVREELQPEIDRRQREIDELRRQIAETKARLAERKSASTKAAPPGSPR